MKTGFLTREAASLQMGRLAEEFARAYLEAALWTLVEGPDSAAPRGGAHQPPRPGLAEAAGGGDSSGRRCRRRRF